MLLLSLLAGIHATAAQDLITAERRILSASDGRQILQVMFDCPDDVAGAPELQVHADAVAAQFGVPVDTRGLRIGWAASTVTFTDTGTGWRLLDPALFLSSPPRYVPRAAERSRWFAPLDSEAACENYTLSFHLDSGSAGADRSHFERPVDGAPTCS